jgi:hypothetical protein
MLKPCSKKIQRRLELLEEQTGVRFVEQLAIKRSNDHCINTGYQHNTELSTVLEKPDTTYSGYSFFLNENGIFETSNKQKKSQHLGIIKTYKMKYK